MADLTETIAFSVARLERVQAIADELQHDENLHRLAMQTVFILQDCHEALLRIQGEASSMTGKDLAALSEVQAQHKGVFRHEEVLNTSVTNTSGPAEVSSFR